MKVSKLTKFAWVFFALALTTTTVFSQGWRNSGRMNNRVYLQNQNCLNSLTDLTDGQISKIESLEASHQEVMSEFRDQRRSTIDAIEKNEIRGEMLKKVEAHRKEVKGLLSAEQQKQYDLLHSRGNAYRNQPARGNFAGNRFNGRQGNNGRQNFAGRGCMGNRNNGGVRQNNGRRNNCFQNNRNTNSRGNRNFNRNSNYYKTNSL